MERQFVLPLLFCLVAFVYCEESEPGCLSTSNVELSGTCMNYTYTDEEYEEFKKILDEELSGNFYLNNQWDSAKGEENKTFELKDEEFRAIKVFAPSDGKVYKDYVKAIEKHGSVDAEGFEFKGLHYFLSSAFEKLSESWGTRFRVIYLGRENSKFKNAECQVNDTANFAGFGMGFEFADVVEKDMPGGGIIFSVAANLNIDIYRITGNRDFDRFLVSPCDEFRVVDRLDREGISNKATYDVIKASSIVEPAGSATRIGCSSAILLSVLVMSFFL